MCDGLIYMLDRWTKLDDIGIPELMQFVKGPDFPTGGLVFRFGHDGESDALAQAYATGRGKITIRAKAHVEQLSRNRNRIIITELPFQNNEGVIELKVKGLLPNLASQVQIQSGAGWVNVTNANGDRAWFHETLVAGEVVRYAYGHNALGGLYRWVIYDKAEGLDQGWAVSAEFVISEMGKHIVVEVTLPGEHPRFTKSGIEVFRLLVQDTAIGRQSIAQPIVPELGQGEGQHGLHDGASALVRVFTSAVPRLRYRGPPANAPWSRRPLPKPRTWLPRCPCRRQ